MLHPTQYFLCWASGIRRGAVDVRWDPVGDQGGDVSFVSPADNKVVMVGELYVVGGLYPGNN
jgi:hypothetical protein